jgi:hypothetical protein
MDSWLRNAALPSLGLEPRQTLPSGEGVNRSALAVMADAGDCPGFSLAGREMDSRLRNAAVARQ